MIADAYSSTYTGCPGCRVLLMSRSQVIDSVEPNQPAAVAGNRMMLDAKIGGITPAMLSFSGRCELWPP